MREVADSFITNGGAPQRVPLTSVGAEDIDAELGRKGHCSLFFTLAAEFGCIPSEAEPLIATMRTSPC